MAANNGGIAINRSPGLNNAPFIHHNDSTRAMYVDVTLALLTLYAMSFYYYGPRVLALGAISVFTAVICDWLCVLVSGRRIRLRDLSPVITGLMLPLMMPASIDFHIPALAAVFAILSVKAPFGGNGHNVFNPAAAGFAVSAICFPVRIFSYPKPQEILPVLPTLGEIGLAPSASMTLNAGGIPQYDLVDLLLGNHAGPMGATNILLLLACLLYLVFRSTVRWEIPVFFILTTSLLSFLLPRSPLMSQLDSLTYEMMSGMLLFGAVFMLGDPVTSPKRDWAKIAYAVITGCVVMAFRHIGNVEEGFAFALLLMNSTVWGFDMAAERLARMIRVRSRRAR